MTRPRSRWDAEPQRREDDRPNWTPDKDAQRESGELHQGALVEPILSHCLLYLCRTTAVSIPTRGSTDNFGYTACHATKTVTALQIQHV